MFEQERERVDKGWRSVNPTGNQTHFTRRTSRTNIGPVHIFSELEDTEVRARYNRTVHLSKQRIKLEATTLFLGRCLKENV